jgi:nucleoside-diphosphate-sugar epimerase
MPNMRRTSGLRRAHEVLGFAPQYDLVAALADMVAWLDAIGHREPRSR